MKKIFCPIFFVLLLLMSAVPVTAADNEQTYTITVNAGEGGTVSGGGTFQSGQHVTLSAYPNGGWTFAGWYDESGDRISANASLGFSATSHRIIQARFVRDHASQIPNNHSEWAALELLKAVELSLIPDSLTDPDIDYSQPVTRAEFAGIAVRAYEILTDTTTLPAASGTFTDTSDEDALKAYNAGIMVGISDTEFSPGALLDREQCATALTRIFKRATMPGWSFATDGDFHLTFIHPTPFTDDEAISDWARESVYFMVANKIMEGIGNNMFAPRNVTGAQEAQGYATATREQALIIALRMIENLQ